LLAVNEDEIVFLTQEEQELFSIAQTEMDSQESEEYKQGFENSIMEVYRQYNLRSKKNQDTASKRNVESPVKKDYDSDPKIITQNLSKKATKNLGKKLTKDTMENLIHTSSRNTQLSYLLPTKKFNQPQK